MKLFIQILKNTDKQNGSWFMQNCIDTATSYLVGA